MRPSHLAVGSVRDQAELSEERHHAALVGRRRGRRRIVGLVGFLHAGALQITPPSVLARLRIECDRHEAVPGTWR
jgi:hypothetical protein